MANHETVVIGTAGQSIDATFDARDWDTVCFTCAGLGAAETVTIQHDVAGGWVTAYSFDPDGATNTALLFTGSGGTPANVNSMDLKGMRYRFTSTTPVGVVRIQATYGMRKP